VAGRGRGFGVDADHQHYKWWALSCTGLGMLLATVNSGTLIIALPNLERSLHTSLLELVWVILVYMIASTVLVLSAGRLSDQFGRKNAYIGGFLVFVIGSLGAGFAANGTELILWRILQGIGGSFLFANIAAIVTDAFPREQLGVAMGTNTMIAAVGLVIGPVLGGALVNISWHWVFWFNVPFGLLGSLWALGVLREVTGRSQDTQFDVLGTITFLVGLTGLVYGISRGGLSGWGTPLVIGALVLSVILLPLFVVIEDRLGRAAARSAAGSRAGGGRRRATPPMLDLEIFRSRMFSAAALATFLNGMARFALMFLFVFYFQGVQGDSPVVAGVKLAPLAVAMLISSPLAGVYADRRGSRALASIGMLVTALGLGLMTLLQRDSSYWEPGLFLFIVGVGSGLFNSPNGAAMMGTVAPHRRGIASGARILVMNTGAVMSIAFVLAIVTSSVPKNVLFAVFSGVAQRISTSQLAPFVTNMHTALWCLTAVSILGAAVSFARPKHGAEQAPAALEGVPGAAGVPAVDMEPGLPVGREPATTSAVLR
jgi:MFS family permease